MNCLDKKWTRFGSVLALVSVINGCGTTNTATNKAGAAADVASAPPVLMIKETGSSLMYPLLHEQWLPEFEKINPSVKISAHSTASGTGISQAIAGTVQVGASDTYMTDKQMKTNPGMLNIPLAVSAQQIMYNLPGLNKFPHLKLTGGVLADMYMGNIHYWDDSEIKILNMGISLPHKSITLVGRSDSSGDTLMFTQFLSATNSAWKKRYGFGLYPLRSQVSNSVSAKGNSGMVSGIVTHPYSIGYVGISWLDKATEQGLGYAQLKNRDGNFELPDSHAIRAAANVMAKNTPADERMSLIYTPGGNSYPITNFEYVVVNSKQSSADMTAALKKFLRWAIDPKEGSSDRYLEPVHFVPLPDSLEQETNAQIDKISS